MEIESKKLTHNYRLAKIHGDIKPLKGRVLVRDLEKGERVSHGGIIVLDDDGTERGIRPRWAQVWRIGEEVDLVEPGQWILVEHGRWSRTIVCEEDGEDFRVNLIDYPDGIMLVSDDMPATLAIRA